MTKTNGTAQDEFELKKKTAGQLLSEEKYAEALALYDALLKENPEYAEGYCDSGFIHIKQGNYTAAKSLLVQAIQLNPELISAYFNLAVLYEEIEEYEKALVFYKEAVSRDKQDSLAYLRMGFCTLALNNKTDACAFFEEAFRLQPNSIEAGAALASLYIQQNRYAEAENVLRVSLISWPEDISLHLSLGLVLKEQGKHEKALAHFKRIVSIDENHVQGYYLLGECCMALEMYSQAEPFLAKAWSLDSSFADPVLRLGRIHEKKKKKEKMAAAYVQWVNMIQNEIQPEDAAWHDFVVVCNTLNAYYKKHSDQEKAAYYLNLTQKESNSQASADESDDDFNVSLVID